MIKFGLILGPALAILSGVAVIVCFIVFLIVDPPWYWLLRLAVSLALVSFSFLAFRPLQGYLLEVKEVPEEVAE